jgi:hypothetical protein
MDEAFPADQQGAECTHFEAALTIATMLVRSASGKSGQAATMAARSGSLGSRWVAPRVEDKGGSERRPVIERIGVEPSREITPRESGLTSLECLCTRPSDQPAWETEQMMAASLLVRSPVYQARWPQTSIVQVERLRSAGSREGP